LKLQQALQSQVQVKVTNLDAGSLGNDPHPTRTVTQAKIPVNIRVEIEEMTGEVTEQMRLSYDKFWQLLLGRLLDKSPDP
jgi:hypothetical protein